MFVRGALCGLGIVTTVIAWLRFSRATPHDTRHVQVPLSHVDRTVVARRRDTILAQIAKESPWILNHNAKPSTNSSASSLP